MFHVVDIGHALPFCGWIGFEGGGYANSYVLAMVLGSLGHIVYHECLVEVPGCLAGVGHVFSHVHAPVAPPPSAAAAATMLE